MKISKRDSILLAIVGTIAVLGGFWWFYVKPAKADLSAAQQQVTEAQSSNQSLQDQLDLLAADRGSLAGQTAEQIRLAKAVPDSAQVPAAVVQLQRLADRTDIELSSIQAGQITDLSGFTGRQFLIEVTGRFFDVDDFLYRMHNMVTVDATGKPVIRGRLFAVTKIEMTLKADGSTVATDGSGLEGGDAVKAIITAVLFSSGSAAGGTVDPGAVSPNLGGTPATQPISTPVTPPPATAPADGAQPAPQGSTTAPSTPAGTTSSPGGTP